jgi:hypothetical protein
LAAPFGPNGEKHWIVVRMIGRETKLLYNVIVGPMADAGKRKEILSKLLDERSQPELKRSTASKVGGKTAVISSAETVLEWGENEEPDSEDLRKNLKKKLDELHPNLKKLERVLMTLC